MSRRPFRTLSAVVATAMLVGACSSGNDTSSSDRRQRNVALPTPWSQTSGTPDFDSSASVAVDANGNVVTAGARSGGDFLPTGYEASSSGVLQTAFEPSVRVAQSAVTLIKYDPTGAVVWSREFESTTVAQISSVGVDAKGNIFVSGTLAGNIDFDPGTGTKYLVDPAATILNRAFVAKFATDGTYISSVTLVSDITYVQDLVVDGSGNVAVTGVYMNSMTAFATDRKISLDGTSHFQTYVARFDSSLAIQWLKAVNSSGYSSPRSIAVDAGGNIVFNLSFDGYALWDTPLALIPTAAPESSRIVRLAAHPKIPAGVVGGYFSAGMIDTLVMKIDSRGSFLWGVQLGGVDFETAAGIGVDSKGNVYTSGTFTSAALWADPDPAGVAPVGNVTGESIGYLARITGDGSLKYVRTFGIANTFEGMVEPNRLAVALDGTTTMTGIYWGKVAFNGDNLTSLTTSDGNFNAYAVSFSSDGKFKWVRTFLGGNVQSTDMAVDTSGNTYFTGMFYSNLVVDDAMDVAVGVTKGHTDGYLVKLSSLGASSKSGSGAPKIAVEPSTPSTLPSMDAVISGVPAPEVSDLKILPDNLPAGINTNLAQKIITVKVKQTVTLKTILASVGVTPTKGAKTTATIARSSKKNCSATSTKVKGLKVGTCTLTIKVTPKSGKPTKSKVSVAVVQ